MPLSAYVILNKRKIQSQMPETYSLGKLQTFLQNRQKLKGLSIKRHPSRLCVTVAAP